MKMLETIKLSWKYNVMKTTNKIRIKSRKKSDIRRKWRKNKHKMQEYKHKY